MTVRKFNWVLTFAAFAVMTINMAGMQRMEQSMEMAKHQPAQMKMMKGDMEMSYRVMNSQIMERNSAM